MLPVADQAPAAITEVAPATAATRAAATTSRRPAARQRRGVALPMSTALSERAPETYGEPAARPVRSPPPPTCLHHLRLAWPESVMATTNPRSAGCYGE